MTALKTVKDFKDLGLEFVEGDILSDYSELCEDSVRILNGDCVNSNLITVLSGFAWRKNTGVKPKFSGEAEWSWGNNLSKRVNMKSLNWDSNIVKWRPYLAPQIATETPEEKEVLDKVNSTTKPTYTQEMADNDILPIIGMEFIYCDSTKHKNKAIVTYLSDWNIAFKCLDEGFSNGVELAKEISELTISKQFKPVPTPRDLVIADLVVTLEKASTQGEDYKIDAAAIYDAGYRKLNNGE